MIDFHSGYSVIVRIQVQEAHEDDHIPL